MAISVSEVEQFLYREARYLDDREFDKWLECYAPDSEFWMPAWDDDDTLVTDPEREISLIYYNNRGGLEDRVFRIKTDRSSATSLPEPRTGHNISNVEIVSQDGDLVEVRFNWLTMYYRYQNIDPYFGTSFYTLDVSGAAAAHQEEEGDPEERLHPPRGRHLPRLVRGRADMSLPDRAHLRGRGHALHRVPAERGRLRRLVPPAHQHPARLPGRGLRYVQELLRVG